jgi:hypothetical protein
MRAGPAPPETAEQIFKVVFSIEVPLLPLAVLAPETAHRCPILPYIARAVNQRDKPKIADRK